MGHFIIGTAGHVDHGKTALIEALTDVNCDTHQQERERGITINLGFSHLDLPSGNSFGIIDMPGHKDFINTMISGANSIDIALLVVAADSGIMPQTLEHLNIIQILGVQKVLVVLNKADLVDEDLIELAKEEIEALFKAKEMDIPPMVAVSAITRQGMDKLIEKIEILASEVKEKNVGATFRMYIDRFFSVKGIGSVVTGSVLSGKVHEGEYLRLYPQGKEKLKIKGIQRHGQTVSEAKAGDRAALNISGFKAEDHIKGALLSSEPMEPSTMIDAHLNIFDDNTHLSVWSTVMFYTGTFETMAKVHLLNQNRLSQNESAMVQIHLEKPICVLPKDKFIIRKTSSDATIGGGVIMDTQPLHHRKRTTQLIQQLERNWELMQSEDALGARIENELSNVSKPMNLTLLAKTLDVNYAQAQEALSGVRGVAKYTIDEEIYLMSDALKSHYQQLIVAKLEEQHKAFPLLNEGLNSSFFSGQLGLKSLNEKKILNTMLNEMARQGVIEMYADTWKLSTHQAKIDEKSTRDLNRLEQIYKAYQLQRPIYKDIISQAERSAIKKGRLKMYLKVLVQQGKLIKHQDDYIHSEIISHVQTQLEQHLKNLPEGINLSEFRQLIGCSKKIVPLLVGILEAKKLVVTQADGEHTNMRLNPKS